MTNLSKSTCVKDCPKKDGTPIDCKTNNVITDCSKLAVPFKTNPCKFLSISCRHYNIVD